MTEEKNKGGRPSLTNGKTPRRNISLTPEQIEHLQNKYGGISKGIRILIQADMQRD